MIGGVTVNLLLAIFIYICSLAVWGDSYLPTSEVKYGITTDALAQEMGLRNGDKILSVDNKYIEDFFKIPGEIILNKAQSIQVLRDDKEVDIRIPDNFISRIIQHNSAEFIMVRVPFVIQSFTKESAARDAGLQEKDSVIGLNGNPIMFFDEFKEVISKSPGETINISVIRNGDSLCFPVQVNDEGVVGVIPKMLDYFTFSEHDYNIFQAIPAGTVKTFKKTGNYLRQLKLVFSPETKAYQSLGGFITIGKIFPSKWNWQSFWELTAFLSIILAIMNLLPIPALDGGHVMFLLYEIITRRKPGDKFLEYAQITGMAILFALLIYANGNDIFRLFNK
jgi:regulator of sigma E protease